jgi:hypothetical protein
MVTAPAFPLVTIYAAAAAFVALVRCGRSEVLVAGGTVEAREKSLGIVLWRFRVPLDAIRRLRITPQAGTAILFADCWAPTPAARLARGYPPRLLAEAAEALTAAIPEWCGSLPVVAAADEPPAPVFREPTEAPRGSRTVVSEADDGITIEVPPGGVLRGASGRTMLAIAAVALVCAIWLPALAPVLGMAPGAALLLPRIGLSFLALGAVAAWTVLRKARRHTALAVVGDRLLALERRPLRNVRHEWARDDLAGVRVGAHASTPENEREALAQQFWVAALRVEDRDGRVTWLLIDHDRADLEWIAARLRRALHLPNDPTAERTEPPPARTSTPDRTGW